MKEIAAELKALNIGQLDGEIRAAFGKRFFGLSTDQKAVRFHVDDDFGDEDKKALLALYEAHTPTETDEQVVERKRGEKRDLRQTLKGFDRANIRNVADILPYLEALIKLAAEGE